MARASPGGLEERQAWAVIASVVGIGPGGLGRLLEAFGSGLAALDVARGRRGAARVVAATDDDPGAVGPDVAHRLSAAARDPTATLEAIAAAGLRILTTDDSDYPSRLRAIDLPPPVLFVRGDLAAMGRPVAVAVVGTRRPTDRGRLTAARIGGALAKAGATVVSGLAVGIDGAAHAAACAEEGLSVAVLGGGHRRLYPAAHRRLADSIVELGGAVISEFPPDLGPSRWSFPRRNRLISGLADATVVVEAPHRSGALHTADWAMEQGRGCFLVPGPIDEPETAGCLDYLRRFSGETRIVSAIPDLLADLGLFDADAPVDRTTVAPGRHRRPVSRRPSLDAELIELGQTARLVARGLVAGSTTLDGLVALTELPVATVLATLTLLESRGLAVGQFGRYRPAGRLANAPASR
jgi:DNA processing protein